MDGEDVQHTLAQLPAHWWAELLGDREAVLATVGTAETPNLREVAAPPSPDPVPVPRAIAPSPAQVPMPRTPAAPRFRVLAWSLMAGGAAFAATGGGFALSAAQSRSQLGAASRDEAGRIVGLTQKQAFELENRASRQANLGVWLLVAGGAVGATGLGFYFLGSPATLVPAPNGVAISAPVN